MTRSSLLCWPLLSALVLHGVGCGGDDSSRHGAADAGRPDAATDAPVNVVDAPVAEGAVDAGAPVATFPTTALDFQLVDCGTAASGTQTVEIQNTGSADLVWSAALDSATYFFLLGATQGVIQAGQSQTVVVAGNAIAPSTVAGTVQSGTLTITTNDPARASTAIPVKQTAGGATLTLTPSAGAVFGAVPVGMAATNIPLTLTNSGNEPVTLNFESPGDAEYGVVWTATPNDVTVDPGASVPGLAITYTPASATSTATSAIIDVTGALCATTLAALPMSGQGTLGAFAASPGVVDFGLVACGTTSALPAAMRTVTITNAGGATFTWQATLGRGASSPFSLTTTNTSIAPGGPAGTVVVTPKAIPQSSPVDHDLYGDDISITTDIPGDGPHTVPITETAEGAILRLVPSSPVTFGAVPTGSASGARFEVENTGNAAATVTLAATSGPAFQLAATALGPLAAGGRTPDTLTFAPTAATAGQSSTVSLALGPADVRCAPLPTLTATGDGAGSVAVSAAELDFGEVACGATALPQTVTVTNTGTASFDVTAATLALGANYVVTSPSLPASVPPGGNVSVVVTPAAIPSASDVTEDLYGDTLTLTTDATGDTPHVLPLHMTAYGAILAVSAGTIAFGGVPVTTTATSGVRVTNSGNAPAVVSLTNAGAEFTLAPQGATVSAGATEIVTASFVPTQTVGYTDAAPVTVQAGTPLCAPLPSSVALSGAGTTGVVVVTPSDLDFGLVGCAATAAPQTIFVQNTGTTTFTWTATPSTSASNAYQFSATSGSLDPGGSYALVVTPVAVPFPSLTSVDLYAGTVTITTTGATEDAPHVVNLHETAFGAILSFDQAELTFPTTTVGTSSWLPVTVSNSGNGPAGLTYSGYSSPVFDVEPSGVPVNGGTSLDLTMTFTPSSTGPVTGQSFAVQSADVLCASLPGAISVTAAGQ